MKNRHDLVASVFRSDFRAFVDLAFRELHPGQKLSGNWHLDVMADRLEGVAKGRIKRLILNAPPRSLKSIEATIALPAFILGRDPTTQIILIAGHQRLVGDLLGKISRLMSSDRYRSLFPRMRPKMAGTTIQTTQGGGIRTAIVGQQISGRGADLIIIDDPISPSFARDDNKRSLTNSWFDDEVLPRLNSRSSGALLLVMQRVHPDDLSGHLGGANHKFEYLVLPSIALADEVWSLSDGRKILREKGVAMDPAREDFDQQVARLSEIGAYNFATQYLQNASLIRIAERSSRPRLMYGKKPVDWSPENSSIPSGFVRITLEQHVLAGAFGVPLPEHAHWTSTHPLTLDEWEAGAIIQQKRLVEMCRNG